MRCITHLLSYPMHHDCPTQPCFHTLTMRVKACTHGCLWATSVTSLSIHTLGLEEKKVVKILKVSKCSAMFNRCTDGSRAIYERCKKCSSKDRWTTLSFSCCQQQNASEGITCARLLMMSGIGIFKDLGGIPHTSPQSAELQSTRYHLRLNLNFIFTWNGFPKSHLEGRVDMKVADIICFIWFDSKCKKEKKTGSKCFRCKSGLLGNKSIWCTISVTSYHLTA